MPGIDLSITDYISRISDINIKSDWNVDIGKLTGKDSFESFFSAALDIINETNKYQLSADQAQIDLATGKTDNILAVLLAQEKAYSSLNFTVQVTNKIIESYREIMRMQA